MTTAPSFRWTCSYQGCVWYEVRDETGVYSVEVRREASEFERATYNHASPLADWERDVVAAVGLVFRKHDPSKPIPPATVAAFNAWRRAEWEASMRLLESDPERYGKRDFRAEHPRPPDVRGAVYVPSTGWVAGDAHLKHAARQGRDLGAGGPRRRRSGRASWPGT